MMATMWRVRYRDAHGIVRLRDVCGAREVRDGFVAFRDPEPLGRSDERLGVWGLEEADLISARKLMTHLV